MRPKYPALKPGESCQMNRPECGLNIGVQQFTEDHVPLPRKVLRGKFVFSRDPLPAPGKYPKKSEVARASVAREETLEAAPV